MGVAQALVGAMRTAGRRAVAALLGRVVVTLVFLLDPATPVLRIRSTGVAGSSRNTSVTTTRPSRAATARRPAVLIAPTSA